MHRVVLLLCGGNIDTTTFGRCLERGLASEGRLNRYVKQIVAWNLKLTLNKCKYMFDQQKKCADLT